MTYPAFHWWLGLRSKLLRSLSLKVARNDTVCLWPGFKQQQWFSLQVKPARVGVSERVTMSELKHSRQQQQRGCQVPYFSVFSDFFFFLDAKDSRYKYRPHRREERRSSGTEKIKDKEKNVAFINSTCNQKHGRHNKWIWGSNTYHEGYATKQNNRNIMSGPDPNMSERNKTHRLFLCSAGSRLPSPLAADSHKVDLKENAAAAGWDFSASTSSVCHLHIKARHLHPTYSPATKRDAPYFTGSQDSRSNPLWIDCEMEDSIKSTYLTTRGA